MNALQIKSFPKTSGVGGFDSMVSRWKDEALPNDPTTKDI
jgi:hypothetical protein